MQFRQRIVVWLALLFAVVGPIAFWSYSLRTYRLTGDALALLMVVGLPASLVVGLFYARQRLRQLEARREEIREQGRRDE